MAQKNKTHGISFPDHGLLEWAKKRAKELDISLSKYINRLIKSDSQQSSDVDPTLLEASENQTHGIEY